MNGAMTELSAKIIRSAKISKRKIMGPSQYLFLKRINCQNSEKMEKREKMLISVLSSCVARPFQGRTARLKASLCDCIITDNAIQKNFNPARTVSHRQTPPPEESSLSYLIRNYLR
jgi:hypothetical protein